MQIDFKGFVFWDGAFFALLGPVRRYFKKPLSVMSLDAFGDVNDIAFDAVPAFRWAVEVGIYRGNDESRLNPKNNAMRSEAAQIFMNLFRTFDSK